MRRLAAALILGLGGLLLTPGAAGGPETSAAVDIQVEIAGTPGTNNWYLSNVTVRWIVTGETWHNCTTQTITVDTSGQRIECSARNDNVGETAFKSVTIKIDKTKPVVTSKTPSRPPDANGWYNHALTVTFAGTDNLSGIDTCASPSYSGADSATASVSGTCRDKAGNESDQSTFAFKYDDTAPTNLGGGTSRSADVNGWYNHTLTVTFQGSGDAVSPPTVCTQTDYSGPDSATASVSGTCRDQAGNESTSRTVQFKYDDTAPTNLGGSASRSPDANGWYNNTLTVAFAGSDLISSPAVCTQTDYSGPDGAAASVSGTCRDQAGNESTSRTVQFKYDDTAPTNLGGTTSRSPDANGWYNNTLTVAFAGSDVTSPPAVCTRTDYSGPDSATASVFGSCRDQAGNESTSRTVQFKYDDTAPTNLGGSTSRSPDANGWYNHTLTVTFQGSSDATSPPTVCTQSDYSGPDSATASVSGSCRDQAGNESTSTTVPFKYDDTLPILTPAARVPDANGWYNQPLTVSFPGTDAISGIAVCTPPQNYDSPDKLNAAVTGSCTNNAGLTTTKSFIFNYDASAPALAPAARPPDANGWYNRTLTVSFPGTDAISGIAACTQPQNYGSPDKINAAITGSCTNNAGLTTTQTFTFNYDATKPQVTDKIPSRPPNTDGWYKDPLTVEFRGRDDVAGIASCARPTYSGPESAAASVSGTCLDRAGNESAASTFGFKYDATGPQVIPSPARGPDSNGWYNHPVSISFGGSDAASGLASCGAPQTYEGPDSLLAVITSTCLDKAGNVGLGSMALKYDATAPQVGGASPDRAPDANGWYNRALTISYHGTDATSDIDRCIVAGYRGPDNASASVSGSCLDRAGNESGANAFTFKYDATPPSLTGVTVKAGNASAVLSWTASADTTLVEVRRAGAVVYRGTGRSFTDTGLRNGVRYRYTLTGYDEARNAASSEVAATPTAPLLAPKAGATVSAPPRLVWKAAEKATYYNVQVWRRGKIFSAWPTGTSVQLKRTWTYDGRRYRLSPGRYRWYVWPGYGRRAQNKFGRLLGWSTFVVR
jgi:hypothetical protein